MITIKRPKDNLAEWVQGISSEAYHADKHIVSSTSLKSILKSPASFLTAMTEVKPDTEAFRFGRMFHMALLEPKEFDEQYIIQPDFGDLRTKAGKDKKADWVNANLCAGAEAMTQDEAIKIKAMVDSVMDHRDSFMLAGMKEVSGYYTDPVTGISCKIRPDCFHQSLNVLIDVKTTQNCAMDEFSKEIANRLYHFLLAIAKVRLIKVIKVVEFSRNFCKPNLNFSSTSFIIDH